ncbi:MAG TPA: methyltransferase domain-containing protein [Bryobacteraceae bacterium]|nr:methyltransferase domain-containing protein [Bryobacteraceae bacterium]
MKLLAAVLALTAVCAAQRTGVANEQYQTPGQRASMARGLASPGRDRTQKPAELVASLGIEPGAAVADIGTGSGYLLPYLSRAVGPKGRVWAEDVFAEMLDLAADRVKKDALANVTCVLGTTADPKLPAGAVDLALMLDVYHHLDDPRGMLARVRAALRPAGVFVIVDYYRREGTPLGSYALKHIRADREAVIGEVEASGFRLVENRDHIPGGQYVLVFRAASVRERLRSSFPCDWPLLGAHPAALQTPGAEARAQKDRQRFNAVNLRIAGDQVQDRRGFERHIAVYSNHDVMHYEGDQTRKRPAPDSLPPEAPHQCSGQKQRGARNRQALRNLRLCGDVIRQSEGGQA